MKIKSVKEIKKLIDKVILPGYTYKTNFSCGEFLIDINTSLIIAAELVKENNQMKYRFVLDTQFLRGNIVTHDEIIMLDKIINIFEENRSFVLSKLKKYTVEEYEREKEYRKKQSEKVLEALKKFVSDKINNY